MALIVQYRGKSLSTLVLGPNYDVSVSYERNKEERNSLPDVGRPPDSQ
jgi:hypothetical protein